MKPIIGITTSLFSEKPAEFMQSNKTYNHSKMEYANCIAKAKGTPFLLPNIDNEKILCNFIEKIDGLLLAGGYDLDPAYFNETNLYPGSTIHPLRDKVEMALAKAALKQNLPILGICRGHQLLNVVSGGSLYQDSSLRPNTIEHNSNTDEPVFHSVDIIGNTHLAQLVQEDTIKVNSTHHQHIKQLSQFFKASAKSKDGVIEAMEHIEQNSYIISVQWHPESMPEDIVSKVIFEDFVKQAQKYSITK